MHRKEMRQILGFTFPVISGIGEIRLIFLGIFLNIIGSHFRGRLKKAISMLASYQKALISKKFLANFRETFKFLEDRRNPA